MILQLQPVLIRSVVVSMPMFYLIIDSNRNIVMIHSVSLLLLVELLFVALVSLVGMVGIRANLTNLYRITNVSTMQPHPTDIINIRIPSNGMNRPYNAIPTFVSTSTADAYTV